MSLDDSSEIVVPQDDYGLYAIDILDPSTVSFFFLLCFLFIPHKNYYDFDI